MTDDLRRQVDEQDELLSDADLSKITTFPKEAQEYANVAFREARAEGCNCDPNIVIMPVATQPFWHVTVEHDEWCRLLAKLRPRLDAELR